MKTKQNKKRNARLIKKWIIAGIILLVVAAGVLFIRYKYAASNNYQSFEELVANAEKGEPYAQNSLGMYYYTGRGVQQDYKKAFELFRSSAEKECIPAINNLGVCYSTGRGVQQDHKKAFELFQAAAKRGYVPALYNSAECYELGRGVEKDIKKATELYQKASDNGMPAARKKLQELNKK